MDRPEQLLLSLISETFEKANVAEDKLASVMEGLTSKSATDPNNEVLEEAQQTLEHYVRVLHRDLSILAERLSLPLLAADIKRSLKAHKKDIAAMKLTSWDVQHRSESLGEAYSFYKSLSSMFDTKMMSGLHVLKTILQNTPAIIKSRGLEPKKEKHVQEAVFEVMKFAFHDAVREGAIGQLFKTFKPDMCVRSLAAAVEYKFVDNESELKVALGEVYSDMKGYGGHSDWKNFFAVIYATDAIAHQEKLEKDFSGVKADTSWTPIIIVGRGGRAVVKRRRTRA